MTKLMIEDIKKRLANGQTVRFKVKIVPGSAKNSLAGMLGEDTLKIKIAAAPEKGKANEELAGFLAEVFSVRTARIKIIAGHTSPRKIIEINP
jgi:uncharacterized protein